MKTCCYHFLPLFLTVCFYSCTHRLPQPDKYGRTRAEVASDSIKSYLKSIRLDAEMLSPNINLTSNLGLATNEEIKDFLAKKVHLHDHVLFTRDRFWEYSFPQEISSEDTDFLYEKDFSFSEFQKNVDFYDINFQGGITGQETKFKGDFSMSSSRVGDDASFTGARFYGNTSFNNVAFDEDVNFDRSVFFKNLDFSDSHFNGLAFFNEIFIPRNCNFGSARFYHYADFSMLHLGDSASLSFADAVLPDILNFSYNGRLAKTIELRDASFSDSVHYDKKTDCYFRPHYINLYKTDISKFRLDYIHFRLFIDSVQDERRSGRYINMSADEVEGMYEALLNNFKTNGQMTSYQLLDIEYRRYKWQNSSTSFLGLFDQYWWNYGYNKERIFVWTGMFLLIFTLISFFCLPYINNTYTLKMLGDVPVFSNRRFTLKDSVKRMWYAFVYTSTIFFRLTLRVEEIDYKRVWGTLYIMLLYTIGIICLAYMANFIIHK